MFFFKVISKLIRNRGLKPALRSNISVNYYDSGYIIYISGTASNKFRKDDEMF